MRNLLCTLKVKKIVEVSREESGVFIVDLKELEDIFNPREIRVNETELNVFYDKESFYSNSNCCYYDRDQKEYLFKTDILEEDFEIIILSVIVCLTSSQDRRLKIDNNDPNSYESIYYQAIKSSTPFSQGFENIIYGVLTTSSSDFQITNENKIFNPLVSEKIETERGEVLFFEIEDENGISLITPKFKGYISRILVNGHNVGVQVENFLSQLDKPLYSNGTYEKSIPDKTGFSYISDLIPNTPRLFGVNAPSKIIDRKIDPDALIVLFVPKFELDYDSMYEAHQMSTPMAIPAGLMLSTCYIDESKDTFDQIMKEIQFYSIAPIDMKRVALWLQNNDDINYLLTGDYVYGFTSGGLSSKHTGIVESYLYDEDEDRFGVILVTEDDIPFNSEDYVLISCINGLFIEDKQNNTYHSIHIADFLTQHWISNNILIPTIAYPSVPVGLMGTEFKVLYRIKNLRPLNENNHALIALEILRTEFPDSDLNIQSFIDASLALDTRVSIINVEGNSLMTKKEGLKRVLVTAMTFLYIDENQKISYGIIDNKKAITEVLDENKIEKSSLTYSWENQDSYNTCIFKNEDIDFILTIKDLRDFSISLKEDSITAISEIDFREYVSEIIKTVEFTDVSAVQQWLNACNYFIGKKMKISFTVSDYNTNLKLGDMVKVVHRSLPEECLAMVTNITTNVKIKNVTVVKIINMSDKIKFTLNGKDI